METLQLLFRLAVGLGLLYVWLVRFSKPSPYRGGAANDMVEEFSEYGLPQRFVWIVGGLKVAAAVALILSIFLPWLTLPSAALISVLMAGAIVMHFRIHDRPLKIMPAATLLVLTLVVAAT